MKKIKILTFHLINIKTPQFVDNNFENDDKCYPDRIVVSVDENNKNDSFRIDSDGMNNDQNEINANNQETKLKFGYSVTTIKRCRHYAIKIYTATENSR